MMNTMKKRKKKRKKKTLDQTNKQIGNTADTTDPSCLVTVKLRQIGNPNVFTSGAEKCYFK